MVVKPQDLQDLISTNCNEVEMKRFNDTHELDSSVTLSGLRFRANFYKTINGPAAVLRRVAVSYTHLRAHETKANLVCRLLLEKKNLSV